MGKLVRLDRFLCDMNIGTRSEAKAIIKKKKITVNGLPAIKDSQKIDIEQDEVAYDGQALTYIEYEYYMLNKPAGVVSATKDDVDKTVVELIKDNIKEIHPVGRLDKDTEGLLLLTNDGELSHALLSPKKHVDKKYFAKIKGQVEEKHIDMFREGLNINDEYVTKPAMLEILKSGDESEIYITIVEGKYHQVKRMFKAIGMEVVYLKRVSMGPLKLDENLELGEYRKLTDEEVKLLKKQTRKI